MLLVPQVLTGFMSHLKICAFIHVSPSVWLTSACSLELPTPVPTLHPAPLPLHAFLGHPRERHIISLCLRDPADNQNMPANTNGWVQTKTVRGVRKVAVTDWIKWCKDSRPDFIWAFVDVPKTLLGGEEGEAVPVGPGEGRQISQKRITKCIERSVGWIQTLLGTLVDRSTELNGIEGGLQASPDYRGLSTTRPPVIVSLLGGCDPRAREEFSLALVEKQDSIDVAKSGGLKRLDDGIFGYAVDMVDLPTNSLDATPTSKTEPLTELLRASLQHLPETKPRIAHTSSSPHAILRLISEHGFDLFDLPWVREAADLGVVLEYQFPPPRKLETERDERGMSGSLPIGSNLFEARFATDFGPLGIFDSKAASWPMAPTFEASRVLHSSLDRSQWEGDADATHGQPYTRAYVHHLLHTHEMSAYALLHLHNLAVSSRFFEDIQEYLSHHTVADFREEVIRFYQCYKLPDELFKGARLHWKEVELARGKGRLKREREAAASLV